MQTQTIVENYINDLHKFFKQTEAIDVNGQELTFFESLEKAAMKMMEANANGNKVIFVGNGGSATVASHKALDYWLTAKIKAMAYADASYLTCFSNDFGYENVYVKHLELFAKKGDILVAISSSGNSENIVQACQTARRLGCLVYTCSGFKNDNRLRKLGDLNFYTPVEHYNLVETLHLLICDSIMEVILKKSSDNLVTNELNFISSDQAQAPEQKDTLVVLDRDDTLIYDPGYFGLEDNWKDNLKLYDGAVKTIKNLNNFADVIVATNQIGVARGYYGPKRVEEINKYLDSLLKAQGALIDGWYYSPFVESSWAEKEGLDLDTPWIEDGFPKTRKPEIGMLEQGARDLGRELSSYKNIFVIGDKLDDLNTALNAGGIGIWFYNGKNESLFEEVKRLKKINPEKIFYVKDLTKVIDMVQSVRNWFHL